MFHHSAWAASSYRSGPPAVITVRIKLSQREVLTEQMGHPVSNSYLQVHGRVAGPARGRHRAEGARVRAHAQPGELSAGVRRLLPPPLARLLPALQALPRPHLRRGVRRGRRSQGRPIFNLSHNQTNVRDQTSSP